MSDCVFPLNSNFLSCCADILGSQKCSGKTNQNKKNITSLSSYFYVCVTISFKNILFNAKCKMHPRRTMKKSSTMGMSFQKIQNYGGLADP